jgi:hypothetical protein
MRFECRVSVDGVQSIGVSTVYVASPKGENGPGIQPLKSVT